MYINDQYVQTVIDDVKYRPGWFRVDNRSVFAPPKTGFSSLKLLMGNNLRGVDVPKHYPVYVGVRDPFSRFVSQYTMAVVHSWGRQTENNRLGYMGQAFIDRWFPEAVADPVGFAEEWLECAWPELERVACDYHVTSQARALRGLLGANPVQIVHLIDYTRMGPLLESFGVGGYRIKNPTRYDFSPSMYEYLRKRVYQLMAEDCAMYRQAKLNNICV